MSRNAAASEHFLGAFRGADGGFEVGGVSIGRLASRVGRTPFFAYDRSLITRRIANLRQALPEQVHLRYAIKANPMAAVVQHLAFLVDGFDVASAGELKLALDTPMPAERISFAGPGKTVDELGQAVAAGNVINFESVAEMEAVSRIAQQTGLRPQVLVRVNPDFELRGSGMRMGGGAKPFGIDAEQVPQMLARMGQLPVQFIGFHIFSGSQNLDAAAIVEAQEKTIALAINLATHAPAPVRLLNIGGGFGIPYFAGNEKLDLDAVGAGLSDRMKLLAARLPRAEVIIELGRYIVGEAGVYVCRVVDRKESRGQTFLVTDGGLHHHLAASGNFGQVIRRNYPVAVASRLDQPATETVSVVGCLCTPLDMLAENVHLPRADVGDLIAVFGSGAYAMTASPNRFLSHPDPVEILV